jgi:hypothetical protein
LLGRGWGLYVECWRRKRLERCEVGGGKKEKKERLEETTEG